MAKSNFKMIDDNLGPELSHLPFERRFLQLKQEYYKWLPMWKDLTAFIDPERGMWEGKLPNWGSGIDFERLIDATPTRASRVLAAGMQSGLTSPARIWFKLGVSDPDLSEYLPVREYFDTCEQLMMAVFSHSNLYDVFYQSYEELSVYGTACSLLLEDFNDIIRARNLTAGQYMLDSGADGRVNVFARFYWMTVAQLIEQFGIDNVTPQVQQDYKNGQLTRWIQVYHLIEPNDKRIPHRKDFKGMAYRSVYWEYGSPQTMFLKVSGFNEFPVMAPRWDVIGSDVYGKNCPGRLALGDSKQLQQTHTDKLIGLDKLINPPLSKPAGVDYINALPNGVTPSSSLNANQKIEPLYQINVPLGDIRAEIQALQQSIEKDFYVDLFLMIAQQSDTQETAYEVSKKYEEKLLMLGPVLERLYSEQLKPVIHRVFNMLNRAKLLPKPPQEIQGNELSTEFISVLAQAQKMIGITPIAQTMQFAGEMAQTFPSMLDNIDSDEAITQYAMMAGVPPKILRDPRQVVQMRQQRQKQQAAQQQIQAGLAMSQGAKNLAGADTSSNNALTALLGGPDALNQGQGGQG